MLDWDELLVKERFRLRLQSIFQKPETFWYSFDDQAGAHETMKQILTDVEWNDFGEVTVAAVMDWHQQSAPKIKRKRKLDLDRSFEHCSHPGSQLAVDLSEEFENIVRGDPSYLLEIAKRLQKNRKSDPLAAPTRHEKELRDKERFALELATLIQEAALPVSLQIETLQDPKKAWFRIFGSRRSKTLRNRFRAWSRFRAWLIAYNGQCWPKDLGDVIAYVEENIENGCGISFPSEFQAAFVLLEQTGRVHDDRVLSSDATWLAHLESWKEQLGRGHEPKAAKPYSMSIILSLEMFVCQDSNPMALRVVAWSMLVATWASMRVDDLQNGPNSLLAGYVQNLVQTLLHFVYSICDSHSLYVHPEVRSLFVGCVLGCGYS